jgi:hypothetical protein
MSRARSRGVLAVLAAGVLSVSGCAALGMGWDRKSLIEAASFQYHCPTQEVKVQRVDDDGPVGTGRYQLIVGTPRRYRRVGAVYYDPDLGK